MASVQRILVTGATGYIGGRLIPALLDEGHEVRGMARVPSRLAGRMFASHPRFSAVAGDVLDAASLTSALAGVDAAYYLIHSLGAGADFGERDVRAARTFAGACATAGVGRIIYLSASAARATSCRSISPAGRRQGTLCARAASRSRNCGPR